MTITNNDNSAEQNTVGDCSTPNSATFDKKDASHLSSQNNGPNLFSSKRATLKRKFGKRPNSDNDIGPQSIHEEDSGTQPYNQEKYNRYDQKAMTLRETQNNGNSQHNGVNHGPHKKNNDKKNYRNPVRDGKNSNNIADREDRRYGDDNEDIINTSSNNDTKAIEQNTKKETYYVYNLRRTGAEQLIVRKICIKTIWCLKYYKDLRDMGILSLVVGFWRCCRTVMVFCVPLKLTIQPVQTMCTLRRIKSGRMV